MKEPRKSNDYDSREAWLRSAVALLVPDFRARGYELPEKVRYSIAFTSQGRKGKITGEVIYPEASADGSHEIIIRCDKDQPVEVLGNLAHELLHLITGPDHGQAFRDAALRMGFDLQDGLRKAMPGPLLQKRVEEIAGQLGPLPHARVDFAVLATKGRTADRPRKQVARMLKAECLEKDCGYTVRVAAKWLEVGKPHCPLHGEMFAPERGPDADAPETPAPTEKAA